MNLFFNYPVFGIFILSTYHLINSVCLENSSILVKHLEFSWNSGLMQNNFLPHQIVVYVFLNDWEIIPSFKGTLFINLCRNINNIRYITAYCSEEMSSITKNARVLPDWKMIHQMRVDNVTKRKKKCSNQLSGNREKGI